MVDRCVCKPNIHIVNINVSVKIECQNLSVNYFQPPRVIQIFSSPKSAATNHAVCIGCLYQTGDQGSFPARAPGNGVPKVILTVGTAFKPALGELYKKTPSLHQNSPI